MRHGLDARRQPDEDAAHACGRRRLGLAGSVEHDERAGFRGSPQLRFRLVVAVEHDPLAGDLGGPRERELAEGRDVGADAFFREQPELRDVRERLRPVDEERTRRLLAVRAHLRADRLRAVDEERRPVPFRQLSCMQTTDRELAALDPHRFRKEFEHLASIGIPMQELLLT